MLIHTITTWIGTVPPLAIAIVIAACYVFVAGGRWAWPMVVDAALLALYVWKPATLPIALLIGVVRHTPALAREVAVLFKLHEFDGWTIRMVLFVLPALCVYARESKPARDLPGAFGATLTTPAPATPSPPPMVAAQPAPEPSAPILSLNDGIKALNDDPTAPHVGVIGATRLGKTTFVGVLLAFRQGELVIATPKAAQYDPWFGADVARPVIDQKSEAIDYAPIEQAVGKVYQEMLRRNTPGVKDNSTITLVLDEVPQLFGESPSIVKKVINLLRMGAGCGIRLILMATDVNVRGWKMDGVAGVLDNLVFARVEGDRQWSVGRLDPNWRLVEPRRVDTGGVPTLARQVSLVGRGWAGARAVPLTAPDPTAGLLARLLGAPGGAAPPASVPDRQTNGQTALIDYIKAHPNATRDEARADGHTFDNADFGLLKKAIKRGLL